MQGSAHDAGAQRGSGDDGPGSLPFAHHWLRYHAERRPAACAVACGQAQLSYADLAARSAALARKLQALGIGPESRVGLFVDRSIALVTGVLGILEAGAAYVPLDSTLPKARLDFMVDDASITTFVTQQALAPRLRGYAATLLTLDGDASSENAERTSSPAELGAGNLAYVIYTSGSTGLPKGVMVEHGGLRSLADATRSLLDVGPESRVLQFASLAFDASVFEIFMALSAGATLYVASEDERAAGPELLNLLRERAITHATFLPSTLASLPAHELPALRVLVSAGEPLSSTLTARWARGRRLFNAYGPTEATVWASVHACGPDESAPPIGHALPGVELSIRDEALRRLADGEMGELCIAGAGLARGYLNRPELNAQKFVADPGDPARRLYRTGDLARRLPNGEFMFEGRVDQQVKLRGFRIELGEVEAALTRLPGLREAVVVVREDQPGERRLCAYIVRVSADTTSLAALRAALASQLPDYMIPGTFVALPELPRGPSGKVDRRALPEPGGQRPDLDQAYVPPTSPQELALAGIWSEVLGLTPIGRHDDFFTLGGDSLHAAQIVARAREALHVDLSVRIVFDARTVASLAARLTGAPHVSLLGDDELTHEGPRMLSLTQQGIWFLHQLAPHSLAYHLSAQLHVRGPLDIPALARAWRALAARHEPLRSVFPAANGAVQVANGPEARFALDDDLSTLEPDQREERLVTLRARELHAPFDLACGPLVRFRLVRLAPEEHALLLTVHHIVADGWSMRVWLRELSALYRGALRDRAPELPPLSLRYSDFARQQREQLATDGFTGSLAFWREALAGAPDQISLRTDRARTGAPRFLGGLVPFQLPSHVHDQLKQLCRAEGASLFMGLLAGFALALRAQGAGSDMLIGTPVAGRSTPELEALIGHFANTIPIRAQVHEGLDFIGLLRQVRARALAAYAHQELPFDQLVAALCPRRDDNFRPLVQVVLSQQPPPHSTSSVDQTRFDLELLPGEGAPFELTLTLWEHSEGGLGGELVFDADLFDGGTARAFLERYGELLARCAARPDALLAELLGSERARAEEPSDLAALAGAVLRADPSVDDCVVRRRTSERGEELVAYVAGSPRGARLSGELAALVQVPIAAMPLRADGQVDEAALSRLPVVDAELAQRWQAHVAAQPGVTRASARVRERPPDARRLHSDDLLRPIEHAAGEIGAPAFSSSVASEAVSPVLGALASGGALHIPEASPRTLPEALMRSACAGDARGIRYIRRDRSLHFQSYRALHELALDLLAGLQQAGIAPRERVIVAVDALEWQLPTFWGCLLGGITPAIVALSHDTTFSKLQGAWRALGGPIILSMRQDAATLRALPFEPRVVSIEDACGTGCGARVHTPAPEDIAFYQLTSGSTGQPKCIPETHDAVVRHVHGAIAVNAYRAEDTTFNWLPFDHVVPLLMFHLKDVYLGCDQIHALTEHVVSDPLVWPAIVQSHAVSHTWCPNFGFKLLSKALAASSQAWDLSSLVRFINAGEQVTLPVVQEFVRVTARMGFDPEAVQPAYGMAELATAVTYGCSPCRPDGAHQLASSSLTGQLRFLPRHAGEAPGEVTFVEVGRPVAGVCLRIVDGEQRALPECVIGRVQVRGGVVMPGYLDNESENRRALTADGWLNTGDLGFLRAGSLTITGREKDMMLVRGVNVYCHEVEDIVNAVPGVLPTFAAACGVPDLEAGTEALAIFFVPERPGLPAAATAVDAIRRSVAERLSIAPAFVIPLAKPQLAKTSSGKIQRAQLKQALLSGSYRATLKELDLHAANDRTLPDAFHRHAWLPKEVRSHDPLDGGVCLLLGAVPELEQALASSLRAQGQRVIELAWGSEFTRSAPDRYLVRPAQRDDYARVLAEAGAAVSGVIHLAGYVQESDGAAALLALAGALPARCGAAVRLLVVADGAQATQASEPLAYAKAAVVSLVRTLTEELPHIDARHLDLPIDTPQVTVARVLRELSTLQRDREVAYRGERRLVARLVPVDMTRAPALPVPFTAGGLYLITGGLGGLGEVVARYLLEHQRAHLVLVGRSALTPEAPERCAALRNLSALAERCGGAVTYERADVADQSALRAIIERAERSWQKPLDGAIHLAGIVEERLLEQEGATGLSAASSPKVAGALALAAAMRDRPEALFVAASSANAFLGGFSLGAYAAANRALAAVVHELRRLGRQRSYCLAWSAWDERGMNRGRALKDAARARGYLSISASEGVNALLAALTRPPDLLIVGLERGHFQVERHGVGGARGAHEVCVSYASSGRAELTGNLFVCDRYGVASEAALLPDDLLEGEARPARAYLAPRDQIELQIAAIWRELLDREQVGVDDNFFDLGGHSLLMMQLRGRLYAAFGRDVPVMDLFRNPSIGALSAHLRGEALPAHTQSDLEARGQKQRLRQAQQRRIQRPLIPTERNDPPMES